VRGVLEKQFEIEWGLSRSARTHMHPIQHLHPRMIPPTTKPAHHRCITSESLGVDLIAFAVTCHDVGWGLRHSASATVVCVCSPRTLIKMGGHASNRMCVSGSGPVWRSRQHRSATRALEGLLATATAIAWLTGQGKTSVYNRTSAGPSDQLSIDLFLLHWSCSEGPSCSSPLSPVKLIYSWELSHVHVHFRRRRSAPEADKRGNSCDRSMPIDDVKSRALLSHAECSNVGGDRVL
jgi:hypothetical protein